MAHPAGASDDDVWDHIDVLLSSWSSSGKPKCETDDSGQATLIAKLTNAERFKRIARERRGDNDEDEFYEKHFEETDNEVGENILDNDEVIEEFDVCLCHSPGCGALDTGCAMALIDSNTL